MDADKPEWLTNEFIKIALNDGDDIEIKNIEIKNAVAKGENYTSDVLRFKVEYKDVKTWDELKRKQLIIKAPILAGGTHDTINEMGIVQKEFKIYYEFLPKLLNLLSQDSEHMIATCFPSAKENFIVMEDLNAEGYILVDRFQQLDYQHSEIVFKNLAKFHAASAKLVELEPELIDKFGEELIFNRNKKLSEESFIAMDQILGKSQLKFLSKEIETWPESKHYAGKLTKLMDTIWDIQYGLFDKKDFDFNTFVHGDLWSSNMLFKYSTDGKPENVKFVDLQIIKYCDVMLDLLYFIFTSIQFDVIDKQLDELLKIYLNTLNEYLEKYGCTKRLTAENFQKSYDEREIYGFLTSCRILLFVFAEKDKVIDMKEKIQANEEYNRFQHNLKSKKFRSVYAKLLDYFSKKTWFQNI